MWSIGRDPEKEKIKKRIRLRFIAILIFIGFGIWLFKSGKPKATGLKYEVMDTAKAQTTVLLQDPIDKEIDTAKLDAIADSLFAQNASPNPEVGQYYRVWFYYRRDWRGHPYFAGKFWQYDEKTAYYKPWSLDVMGITGNDKQDNYNEAHHVYRQ
jgi:hypothetical protein